MTEDFGDRLADLVKKSDEQISDEMMEILRLKRIAEQTERIFEAQRNAETPIPVALGQSSASVELSPRDVGEMYGIIRRLSRGVHGHEFMELVEEANKFIYLHEPRERWEPR
jgi:hypothetical protein